MLANSNKNVLGSSVVKPWKWGRVEGLIFLILVSPLVSRMGKVAYIISPFSLAFLFSAIGCKGMVSSSSYRIGFSNIYACSPKVSSWSQLPKKRKCWLCEAVGVLGKKNSWVIPIPTRHERKYFWLVFCFFPTLIVPTETGIMIEQNKLQLAEMNLLNGNLKNWKGKQGNVDLKERKWLVYFCQNEICRIEKESKEMQNLKEKKWLVYFCWNTLLAECCNRK